MAIAGNKVTRAKIDADAIDGTKVADDAINSEHYTDGSIDTAHIGDDQVTADKLANSINTEISANTAKTTNATHSGEVTGATALTIADNVVDEANLKVSNSPTNGYFLSAQSGDTGGLTWAAVASGGSASYNGIINGDFSCWQRGTSFTSGSNNDDTCTASRWVLLSDGNDIVDVTRAAGDTDTGIYSLALDVETVDKKFGIVQIIENINCAQLGGKGTAAVSLSFKAKVAGSGKLDNVKAAVIAWSGSADSVTSDVVSAWNAEGTAPTLATNWTYENTAANLSVSTSWARYEIENISVDTSSTSNVAVFIWSDVTDTDAGDFLYLADVQLEPGATANPFQRQTHDATLAQCQRYYHRGLYAFITSSATTCVFNINFPVQMRTSPTTSHEYAEGGTANDIYQIASAATPQFVPNGSFPDKNGYRFAYDFDAGLTDHEAYQAYFYFEAEL
jgi:hypothetical protein